MLKGKVLLFCLLFVAVTASFLIAYHAKGKLPHIVSVEIGSLLVFEAMVAFFCGYHCAIGKPAKFKMVRDGDYYATFDLEGRVVEMKEVGSSHLEDPLLISELPPELTRSINDEVAKGGKGSKYKVFSKRTLKIKEKKTVIDVR